MNDREAMYHIQMGNRNAQQAMETLVIRHERPAKYTANTITRDPLLAEEAVQESFLKVHHKADRFDLTREFKPWFFKIVTTEALATIRRRRAAISLDENIDLREKDLSPPWAPNPLLPLEYIAKAETSQEVREALDRLPDIHRAVIALYYFGELSELEIADHLGCPPGTVKSRLFNGKRKLRELLAASLI